MRRGYALSPESYRQLMKVTGEVEGRGGIMTKEKIRKVLRPEMEKSAALHKYQSEFMANFRNRNKDLQLMRDKLAFEREKIEKQDEDAEAAAKAQNRSMAINTASELVPQAYGLYKNPPSWLKGSPEPMALSPESVPSLNAGTMEQFGSNLLNTSVEGYLGGAGQTVAPLASGAGEGIVGAGGEIALGSSLAPAATQPALALGSSIAASPAITGLMAEGGGALVGEGVGAMAAPVASMAAPVISSGVAGTAGAVGAGVGGTVAGAETGATVGSIIPGAGTLVGGVIGAGIGYLTSKFFT